MIMEDFSVQITGRQLNELLTYVNREGAKNNRFVHISLRLFSQGEESIWERFLISFQPMDVKTDGTPTDWFQYNKE